MVENMRYDVDPEWTPQTARVWTETSPNSKLKDINDELNSLSWNKVDELKDLIKKREYKQFQKEIWFTSKQDLDWKLWGGTLNKLKTYLKTLDQIEANERGETRDQLGELWLSVMTPENISKERDNQSDVETSPEKIQNQIDNLKINRAAKKYLSEHETLPSSMYNLLFSWKEELEQWDLWNCYLISWLIELANSQYFDTLMKTSISRVKFKDDWTSWFTIKIPLWEPDGRDILIKDSEILMAKVRWNIGYKLLELAYTKNKRPNNKAWNEYYPVTDQEIESIEWWFTFEAIQTFLWGNNLWFCHFWSVKTAKEGLTLSHLSQGEKNEIINYLKNYNWSTWNNYTEIGTSATATKVWEHRLSPLHAYALVGVETKNWEIAHVNVKDPHGKNLELTLDEFFHAFDHIVACKIKVDTFLDDKWVSYA